MKKRYFDDLSLKAKLAVSLFLCIVLPIFIIATSFGQQMSSKNRKNAYNNQLTLMRKDLEDVESVFSQVLNLKNTLLFNFDLHKIANGTADARNYYQLSMKIKDLTQNMDFVHSITLSNDKEILFQQDKYTLYEKPEYLREALESGNEGYWTDVYFLDNGFFDKDKKLQVMSHFVKFHDTGAVLGFTIKEGSLSALFSNSYDEERVENILFNGRGLIISSNEKSLINSDYEIFSESMSGHSGVFMGENNRLCLFQKSLKDDLLLVSLIPEGLIVTGQAALNFTLGLALMLSLLFGIVFSLIQNRYILSPLNILLDDMEKVKTGQLEITPRSHHKYEIGHIAVRFDEMKARLKDTIDEVYVSKIHEQEAQFAALLSQINPHFLYNTLDSIRWLAYKNKDFDVGEQIEALSDVFRHVLSEGRSFVTIDEEISFIRDYMFLMKVRHGDRIGLEIDLGKECGSIPVPKLIIQPLVENSILHGLESKVEGGLIRISIHTQSDHIVILVEDNGIGAQVETVEKMMTSTTELPKAFALSNIDKRLKLCYGEDYGLSIESEIGNGFKVSMRIPFERIGND